MGLLKPHEMSSATAFEVLINNTCARLFSFTKQVDKRMSDPGGKIIATHEFLLFLIYFNDRAASDKGVPSNMRRNLRESTLRGLLEKELLPPRIAWKLIEDGLPDSFMSLGLSNSSITIEALLPIFHKEANEADEYYASCILPIGKHPLDDRGWFNRLSQRICERLEMEGIHDWNSILESYLPILVAKVIYDKNLAKSDIKALDILQKNAHEAF